MKESSLPGDESSGQAAWTLRAVSLCGLAILILACFGPVLFGGGQFAFRDAGHYYYPLYLSVQQQWREGIVPLWEPAEDGGIPLLGSPQAAVFYPGKLIYAVLPYAWAARLYVAVHVLLAFASMRAMLRSWEVSASGSTLAGIAYAFGAPVLFQYCNVIYLIGAAWAPLGFRSADGWLRLGRRWALIELALILAMQALGGDLQAAYLTVVCAAGYAVVLATRRPSFWIWASGISAALVGWAVVVASLGSKLFVLRSQPARIIVATAWGIALVALFAKGLRGRERSPLGSRTLGLAVSGVLAIMLGAIQFVPVAENLAASARWGEFSQADVEDFSLMPYRALESIWPNAFGSILAGDRFWLPALPPTGVHRVWTPSLYFGVLPLILAIGAAGFRGGPPWRGWLSSVALLGFLAATGKFADPSAWFGFGEGGSAYRLLTAILPGFAGFRYPSKFLVFVALAMSGLAGIGWDRACAGRATRAKVLAASLLTLSLLLLAIVGLAREPILKALAHSSLGGSRSMFGPFDPRGAWDDMLRAAGHGAIASAAALAVILIARVRPLGAGAAAILILAVDLSITNAGLIFTLPQEEFDRPSKVSKILRDAESSQPTEGGFRVYRMALWAPTSWTLRPSGSRTVEVATWERETLLPNFGMLDGIDSTLTASGTLEPEEFESFFRPYVQRVAPKVAEAIGAKPGQDVLCYPRRAFDLWNTRYFLLPVDPADWKQGSRALISFLDQTELIYPRPGKGPGGPRLEDFQIRRNLAAFPRAWTVHDYLAIEPGAGNEAAEIARLTTQQLSRGSAARATPGSRSFDPRASVLIETASPETLNPYRSEGLPSRSEMPKIVLQSPQRVEIAVNLEKPGLVVLAERFDPGWRVTIDSKPAVVLKANRLMRAVAVEAGSHRIVYRYDPLSFRVGGFISLFAVFTFAAGCYWARREDAGKLDLRSVVPSSSDR